MLLLVHAVNRHHGVIMQKAWVLVDGFSHDKYIALRGLLRQTLLCLLTLIRIIISAEGWCYLVTKYFSACPPGADFPAFLGKITKVKPVNSLGVKSHKDLC